MTCHKCAFAFCLLSFLLFTIIHIPLFLFFPCFSVFLFPLFFLFLSPFTIPFSFFFSFLFSFFTFSSFQTPFRFSSQVRECKWKGMVDGNERKEKWVMIVLWLIVFVVCCECLGLCLPSSLPLPFPLCVSCHPCPCVTIPIPCVVVSVCCVRHVTCTVCGGWHSPTHCPAVLHPLCSSLSVPLSSTIITRKKHRVRREEREKGVGGERERKRKKRGVMQKRVEKEEQKEKKRLRHLVFPGCLQP